MRSSEAEEYELATTAASTELLAKVPGKLFIGGQWIDGEQGATIKVHNPANGKLIKVIADATPADGLKALDAAVAAQDSWAATAPRVRGELLRNAWELLMERKEEFALLMTLEMGKPIAEARGEVGYGGEFLRWFSEEAVRINGRYGLNPEGTGHMVISHLPVGPCYFITPWNFPLAMATRKIAPALAAGCTSVIKPATLTPLTTLAFAALLEEAGVPAGVVNVITSSSSSKLSAPIIADDRLRKLSFTGSTPVGVALMKQAADNVLRVSMELGGNAPFVVFDDADLDKAVDGAIVAKFRNIGQACTAANRFHVHESVAAAFAMKLRARVEAFKVGDGTDESVNIGPLVDADQVNATDELVQDAIGKGSTVLAGGSRIDGAGSFYQPTLLTDVPKDARLLKEEIFGPVLAITTFTTEEEGIIAANATEYGLASYVFTESLDRAHRLIEKIQTGMMGINTGLISNAAAPFGGVKQSGLGREGSHEGIAEYLSLKYTLIPAS